MAKPTLEELRTRVFGQTIAAGDDGYETARKVYNGMIDRRPRVVVRCADVGDVMATVEFARDHGVDLSIRGGSHSVPGFGTNDDGVVIDLAQMNSVRVDPQTKTARAEGGCTWGGFNHATYAFGLATTGGIIASTGIAGLTLGGGIGYLTRKFGLSCDNPAVGRRGDRRWPVFVAKEGKRGSLLERCAATAATSGGHLVRIPVATRQGHRRGPVLRHPIDRVRDVLEFYRDYIQKAPEELGMFPAFQIAPPLPFIPEAEHGKPFIIFVCCWSGRPEDAEKAFAPIRKVAPIVSEMVASMAYPVLNGMFDALLPAGLQHYWKADFATELTDGAIKAHMEYGPKVPVVNSTMHIYPINGAANRVAADARRPSRIAMRNCDRYRRHVAGSADNDKKNKWVKGLLPCRPSQFVSRRVCQLHVRRRSRSGSRITTRGTTIGWSLVKRSTIRPTCST
jgi:hypothetical protein